MASSTGTTSTPFAGRSRQHALDALRRRCVEVRLPTRVSCVGPDHVVLDGVERLPAPTLVWAAGIRANSLAGARPARVWVIGDHPPDRA